MSASALVVLAITVGTQAEPLLSAGFIEAHNAQPTKFWVAGDTPFASWSEEDFGRMLGENPNPADGAETTLTEPWPLQATYDRLKAQKNLTFPKWFDPRRRWHWCPTLSQIRDQGICGSCYAHGVTEALSDRYCTMMNITTVLSASDGAFCCKGCGAGCGGGDPEAVLRYLNATGAFTSTCHPYDQGDHRSKHPWPQPKGRNVCAATCDDGENLAKTRHRGTKPYRVPHDPDAIKLELLTNGPAGTQMTVYSDFGAYSGGVYTTECGKTKKCQAWGHAVKILGWGTATVQINGTAVETPYWLGANSWSRDWGEGGYFRIMPNTVGFDRSIGTQQPNPTPAQRSLRLRTPPPPTPEEQLRHALQLEDRAPSF